MSRAGLAGVHYGLSAARGIATNSRRAEKSLPLGPSFCLPLQPGGTRLTTHDTAGGIPKPGGRLAGFSSPARRCIFNRKQRVLILASVAGISAASASHYPSG